MTARPGFRELDRHECEQMLARHNVGRIAYSFHDRVSIEPLHYVFSQDWIFGRTAAGTKLLTLFHHPWVAFEVDEVEGPFDWRSVVAHGTFSQLDGTGTPGERATYARAIDAIRTVAPTAFTPDDPVPHRTVIFGVAVHELTGRAASSRAESSSLP